MKTGIIGLGTMGAGMAWNLHQAGFLSAVWNRTADKAADMARRTAAHHAASPEELAAQCEVVITSVSRDADLLEVVERLGKGLRADAIVADTSTVSRDTARQASEYLQTRGGHFLDCPVSGGKEGARQGSLAMMVGGEENILQRCRPVLASLTRTIVYMGASGSGQATKAVNQIMGAGINQAVTEALAFGVAIGLDMDKVIDVLTSGASGNWLLEHRGRSMLAGDFAPGFKLALHHKDLGICRKMLSQMDPGVSLPLAEMTHTHYQRLMEEGYGEEDISALFRLKRPTA